MNGREFPKLSFDEFPKAGTVDALDYVNDFDYSRYEKLARRISLHNVTWDSEYRNTVDFGGEAARDAWLDNHASKRLDVRTAVQVVPSQTVRVPIPYNAAVMYNYASIELPELTGDGSPLDYEDRALSRVCFFVTGIRYLTPSVTELELSLDIWQTYIYKTRVRSMMLERGSAPMHRVDADSFLSDPHGHIAFVGAKDVSFSDEADDASHLEVLDVGSGDKFVVLALPIAERDLRNIRGGTVADSTKATFYDIQQRNGYQLGVRGYEWAVDGYDYGDTAIPLQAGTSQRSSVFDGYTLYAVAAERAGAFVSALADRAPHILASCAFAAVIPRRMLSLQGAIQVLGIDVHPVDSGMQVPEMRVKLDKGDWGYPDDIAGIAKLYTYPYSRIQLTDDNGNESEIRIEEIEGDSLVIEGAVALSSKALLARFAPTNIGASGKQTIAWKTLSGDVESAFAQSDWHRYLIEWSIPTYSVNVLQGRLKAALDADVIAREREDALIAYRQAARSADTAHENTLDSDATTRANQDRTNANDIANTANSNATNTTNTTNSNTRRTNDVETDKSLMSIVNGYEHSKIVKSTSTAAYYATRKTQQTNGLQAFLTAQTEEALALGASMDAGIQAAGAAASFLTGDVKGAAMTAASVIAGVTTSALTITNNAAISTATQSTNTTITDYANSAADEVMTWALDASTYGVSANRDAMNERRDHANDLDTQTTQNNNALATQTTANNAATAAANTGASTGTADANSGYSRSDAILAAQEDLNAIQARAEARYKGLDSSVSRAGSDSAFSELDAFNRRAISVRVLTQNASAIRQTADYFKRYGYAANMLWDFKGWIEAGEHSYWKAQDVSLESDAPCIVRDSLSDIIESGVTVWRSPEKVGIYE